MKTYNVFGHCSVNICVEIQANSEEAAIKKASKNFGGIESYLGNGGSDKLIGVNGENESIYPIEEVEFDDAMEK